jgi:hypothetical protein
MGTRRGGGRGGDGGRRMWWRLRWAEETAKGTRRRRIK